MFPTPDASAGSTAVYVVGYLADGADWVKLGIAAMVVGCAVLAFGVAVLGGLMMRR